VFYGFGQGFHKADVLTDFCEPVVRPVVLEVRIYLPVQRVRQRSIFAEPGQQSHPVMKFEGLLLNPIRIQAGNNINERAHNKGENCHPHQHKQRNNDHLSVRFRRKVPITDSRERRQRKVAASNELH